MSAWNLNEEEVTEVNWNADTQQLELFLLCRPNQQQ